MQNIINAKHNYYISNTVLGEESEKSDKEENVGLTVHNGRKPLRRLKPTVGCNASKRRRRTVAATACCQKRSL